MSTCVPPTSLLEALCVDINDVGFENMPKKRRHCVYPNALHVDVFTGQWRFFRYQSKSDRIDTLLHIKPSRVVDMLPANDMFIYDDHNMITCKRLDYLYQSRSCSTGLMCSDDYLLHHRHVHTRSHMNEISLPFYHADPSHDLITTLRPMSDVTNVPYSHTLPKEIQVNTYAPFSPTPVMVTQPKTARKRFLQSHPSQNRYFIWFDGEANQQTHPKNYLVHPFLRSQHLSADRLETPIFGNVVLKFEDHVPWFGLFNACVYADYEEWLSCNDHKSFYYDVQESDVYMDDLKQKKPLVEQIPKLSWLERFKIAVQNDFYDPLTSADLINEFHHEA